MSRKLPRPGPDGCVSQVSVLIIISLASPARRRQFELDTAPVGPVLRLAAVLAGHQLARQRRYPIFTSMDLGLACSAFGRWTLSTPSLNSAATLLPSASSGSVKLRAKRPYARSTR